MRYIIRARAITEESLEYDADPVLVGLAEAEHLQEADAIAVDRFQKMEAIDGNLVFNYSCIEVFDTKKQEVVYRYEFNTNFMTSIQATEAFEEALNEGFDPVSVAGETYTTSHLLWAVNRIRYNELRNQFLQDSEIVVVY